jgi:hypothetical protein
MKSGINISRYLFISITMLLTVVSSCNQLPFDFWSNRESNIQIEQTFVFQVEHVNRAWGYMLKGFYIDNKGRWYTFNHSHEPWQPADEKRVEEKELIEKFQNKTLQGYIDMSELKKMYKLVEPASKGSLSQPEHLCADFGIISYKAYIYDEDSTTYTPVILYRAGDVGQKNLSFAGRTLFEWLRKIDSEYNDPPCKP